MQYENNPANGFRDIVRKRNTDAQPDMVMTISPVPTSWAGDKNEVKGHNPQKAHLHPLMDVCVQYENNPASALQDIILKHNSLSAIN